jgi:biofilm protein TabA
VFIAETFREGSEPHRKLLALSVGETVRTDLPGGAFALSQAYLTKPRVEGKWETHRAYIDIQVVHTGQEFMEISDRAKLTVSEDLTPGKDVIFYHPFEVGSVLRFGSRDVGIYYPTDAHLGGVAIGAPTLVRKIVVKVPALA